MIHRPAAEGAAARNRAKLLGKTTWFKPRKCKNQAESPTKLREGPECRPKMRRKGGKPAQAAVNSKGMRTTSVLFVEQTPGGELAKRFRLAEGNLSGITGFRVKVVEKTGTAVKNILHKSNPWADGFCSRANCYPCQTGEEKCCFTRNIVYTSQCVPCKEAGQVKVYIGETSRSAHERGGEHKADYRKQKPDSHILKHQQAEHSGQSDANFKFRISASFQSALSRQITEAVMIRRLGEGSTLNSKGVYNRCSLPRLTVIDDNENKKKAATETNLEFDNEKWPGTEGWVKKRFNQPDIQNRGNPKRLKLDQQTLKEDNPRQEGLEKRKIYLRTDHERDCKRLRPEFEPEEELRKATEVERPNTIQICNPTTFFNIFMKPTKQLVSQKVFKKSENSKPKSKKKKESLPTEAAQKDIRNYFQQNEAAVTAVLTTAAQLQQPFEQREKEKASINSKTDRNNHGFRGEKSEVNWDPGL